MQTILAHFGRYPQMQPQDAVKLLYQRVHGGEHIAPDREVFLARLREEYAAVPHDPGSPLFEEIGGGYVRVQLSALSGEMLPRLADAFCAARRTDAERAGDREQMDDALAVLLCLAGMHRTPFPEEALLEFLARYDGEPVHHSEVYRALYRPAYRVLPASALLSLCAGEPTGPLEKI